MVVFGINKAKQQILMAKFHPKIFLCHLFKRLIRENIRILSHMVNADSYLSFIHSLFIQTFICSSSKHLLRAHYVPDTIVDAKSTDRVR